jgi:hypothetical protein
VVFFEEVALQLEFPSYFGQNWDAFDECVADLSRLPDGEGVVLVVSDAAFLLSRESDNSKRLLVGSFARAQKYFRRPGLSSDLPFGLYLAFETGVDPLSRHEWELSGATLVDYSRPS